MIDEMQTDLHKNCFW